jgi:transposase
MKYDWKFKLQCVEDYKIGKWTKKPKQSGCSDVTFRHKIVLWTRIYDLHGTDALKHKMAAKEWTPEERYELVVRVLAGNSVMSVAVEAGISDGQLYQWVRRYKLYGYDGLELRKGRKPKGPVMKDDNKPKDLTKSEKEELILLRRQNEYLKAENAYLKKLRALIARKKAEPSLKAKRQGSSKDSVKKDTD